MKYSIEEIMELFLKYRRFSLADSIDKIGQCDFESELMSFFLYIKNNEPENTAGKVLEIDPKSGYVIYNGIEYVSVGRVKK